jgi:hypothetical protein
MAQTARSSGRRQHQPSPTSASKTMTQVANRGMRATQTGNIIPVKTCTNAVFDRARRIQRSVGSGAARLGCEASHSLTGNIEPSGASGRPARDTGERLRPRSAGRPLQPPSWRRPLLRSRWGLPRCRSSCTSRLHRGRSAQRPSSAMRRSTIAWSVADSSCSPRTSTHETPPSAWLMVLLITPA